MTQPASSTLVERKIDPIKGWVILARDEIDGARTGDWYIAWADQFPTKRAALAFALENGWGRPYRAARSILRLDPRKKT